MPKIRALIVEDEPPAGFKFGHVDRHGLTGQLSQLSTLDAMAPAVGVHVTRANRQRRARSADLDVRAADGLGKCLDHDARAIRDRFARDRAARVGEGGQGQKEREHSSAVADPLVTVRFSVGRPRSHGVRPLACGLH